MRNVDRKWLPPALILVAVVASVVVYGRLPTMVDLRFEGLLPRTPAASPEPAPRWFVVSFIPALAFGLWLAFRWAPTTSGLRVARRVFRRAPDAVNSPAQFERFGKTYDTIVLLVVMLLLGLHAALLAAALDAPAVAMRILPAVLGGFLVFVGNVMPRLRPNWVAGLRTTRLLENPQLWRDTHRVFGAAFVVSGLATIITGMVAPAYAVVLGLVAIVVSCVIGFVASTRGRSAVPHVMFVIAASVAAPSTRPAQLPRDATARVALPAPACHLPRLSYQRSYAGWNTRDREVSDGSGAGTDWSGLLPPTRFAAR